MTTKEKVILRAVTENDNHLYLKSEIYLGTGEVKYEWTDSLRDAVMMDTADDLARAAQMPVSKIVRVEFVRLELNGNKIVGTLTSSNCFESEEIDGEVFYRLSNELELEDAYKLC